MSPILGISLTILLLTVNAFFVAAEFAVTSSRRAQIESLAAEGRKGADKALYALEHVSLMLSICQLGVTVMSTSLGAVAEPAIASLVQGPLVAAGLPSATAHLIAFVFALLLVLYLHVVFGEMVPKNVTIAGPQRVLLWVAPILVGIGRVLRPIVVGLDHVANFFVRAFGVEPRAEIAATYTAAEVASIVEVSQQEGKLRDELGLLSGTLEFSEETAGSIVVPLAKVITVPVEVTPAQVERAVAEHGFSRFPTTDPAGEITGYIHLKDVLYADETQRDQVVENWRIHQIERISANTEIEDALRFMQSRGTHMVLVEDEADAAIGVLFLEDILEELIGEVRDSVQGRR